MPVAFGINGFGRIGRLVFRAALENPDCNVVAVNDPFLTLDYAAYQLKHDSVHGMLEAEVTVDNGCLVIGETRVQFFAERNPAGKCCVLCRMMDTLPERMDLILSSARRVD
jgi:glyceraldehyde 3-phosphate dehydrogenase